MIKYICDRCKKEVKDFVKDGTDNLPKGLRDLCEKCHPVVMEAKEKIYPKVQEFTDKLYEDLRNV